MSAAALKERLRADLQAAILAKAADEVRLLRTLIASLDIAEAVPSEQDRYVPQSFGEPGAEVPRLELDGEAVGRILTAEIEARLAAAGDYDRVGEAEEAQRLRREAGLIARYRLA